MANPRKLVRFDEIKAIYATFKIDNVAITYSATATQGGSASVGLAVTMDGQADDTVTLTGDGEEILGKLTKVEPDGYCTVQIFGGMTLPAGLSATVTVGKRLVGALGAASAEGYVRQAAPTTGSFVAAEAADNSKARGRIINNDVLTALQILFM